MKKESKKMRAIWSVFMIKDLVNLRNTKTNPKPFLFSFPLVASLPCLVSSRCVLRNRRHPMEVEEEVRRIVEQVKELNDSATSFVSSSSHEELSLRQRSSLVDASITRLHSTLLSDKHHHDPKLLDKAFPFHLSFSNLIKKKISSF